MKSIHKSFWFITFFLLIWNVLGCVNFIMQMNPEMVSSYRENEQAIIQGRPMWATIAFFVGVFGGALGCVLLLLKKPVAFYVSIASLLGVVVTTIHTLSGDILFGVGEMFGIVFLPAAVAVFLVWYAKYVERKGWMKN